MARRSRRRGLPRARQFRDASSQGRSRSRHARAALLAEAGVRIVPGAARRTYRPVDIVPRPSWRPISPWTSMDRGTLGRTSDDVRGTIVRLFRRNPIEIRHERERARAQAAGNVAVIVVADLAHLL